MKIMAVKIAEVAIRVAVRIKQQKKSLKKIPRTAINELIFV